MNKGFLKTIVLIALIASILMACSPKEALMGENHPPPLETSRRKTVLAPVDIPYVVANPLDIIYTEGINNSAAYERTIKISGLKDEEIQEQINNYIEALHTEFKAAKLPPYRGIKALIPDNSRVINRYFNASISFNYNNIISLYVNNHRAYSIPDDKGLFSGYNNVKYVTSLEAVTFDLNTGEELMLKDIFADNVDYISLLNGLVLDFSISNFATEENYNTFFDSGSFKLVAPFRGITEDQKFFLRDNGLSLIFDYRNPEFDNGLQPIEVYIGFDELKDYLAITERFFDEETNIYEGPPPYNKQFLLSYSKDFYSESRMEYINNVNMRTYINYPRSLPQFMIDMLNSMALTYNQNSIDAFDDEVIYVESSLYVRQVGKYTSLIHSFYAYQNEDFFQEEIVLSYDEAFNPIKLEDLFVDGFNYRDIIMEKLQRELLVNNISKEISIDEVFNNLQFRIDQSDILFITKPLELKYTSGYKQIKLFIPFTDFGFDKLTIFD